MDLSERQAIEARSRARARTARTEVFRDFESENAAETNRRASLSVEQRMDELATIRHRLYGDLLKEPMQKVATWEYLD